MFSLTFYYNITKRSIRPTQKRLAYLIRWYVHSIFSSIKSCTYHLWRMSSARLSFLLKHSKRLEYARLRLTMKPTSGLRGSFNNYLDQFWPNFDHLPPLSGKSRTFEILSSLLNFCTRGFSTDHLPLYVVNEWPLSFRKEKRIKPPVNSPE